MIRAIERSVSRFRGLFRRDTLGRVNPVYGLYGHMYGTSASAANRDPSEHDALDFRTSIINVAKPEGPFGPGGRGIYSTKVQAPWHEAAFQNWRRETSP